VHKPIATTRSATGIPTGRLAIWWVLASEVVIFGGLLGPAGPAPPLVAGAEKSPRYGENRWTSPPATAMIYAKQAEIRSFP